MRKKISARFSLYKLFSVAFAAVFMFSLAVLPVNAITISPAVSDVKLEKGSTTAGEFTVFFKEEDPAQLFVNVYKLDYTDLSAQQRISVPLKSEKTLANWIAIEKATLDKPAEIGKVNGDNAVKVRYVIAIPQDVNPGSYYATIVVASKAEEVTEGNVVQLGGNVGYQVMVTIEGEKTGTVSLVDFRAKDGQYIFPYLPVEFETIMKNDTQYHVVPSGNIEILQGSEKVKTVSFNKRDYRVFPGASRLYEDLWSNEGIEDKDDADEIAQIRETMPKNFVDSVFYELRNFRIGVYTAKLAGTVDNSNFSSEVSFLVLPYHLLLTVLVIVLVFAGLGLVSYSMNRRKKGSKSA